LALLGQEKIKTMRSFLSRFTRKRAKEISLKNFNHTPRVVEIVEQVFTEIKAYGHEDPRKKLIAGIVLTGGGAQLKHIKQLVSIHGMDTRIGYQMIRKFDEDFKSIICNS
jgi:cell division protein FtsA